MSESPLRLGWEGVLGGVVGSFHLIVPPLTLI